MKKTLFLLLLSSFWAKSQSKSGFELVKVDSVFSVPHDLLSNFPKEVKFGGISGAEFYENSLYFVSDRAFKSDTNQNSYCFVMDSVGKFSLAFKFFGVDNAEAIRFDNFSQKIFYAFERDDSTGIGYINDQNIPTNLKVFSMQNDSFTSKNRGIESLCFDQNHKLWFAFESSQTGTIPFFQIPYNSSKNNYEPDREKIYQYPFNARICIEADQILSGNIGNGITEILPYNENKLLVMERCFNDKFITMRLFLAKIPSIGNQISKEQVFEFTIKNEFLGKNHALRPDNFEGMVWGKNESNRKTLYIISDDNFSKKSQRTLLLKLREVKN